MSIQSASCPAIEQLSPKNKTRVRSKLAELDNDARYEVTSEFTDVGSVVEIRGPFVPTIADELDARMTLMFGIIGIDYEVGTSSSEDGRTTEDGKPSTVGDTVVTTMR
jgi:hypothetical protein